MIQYSDPQRWLVVQFRPGSAGKLLTVALQTIDRVAPWHTPFRPWVRTLWRNSTDTWLRNEPYHQWGTDFFSRTMPRGNHVTSQEFDRLCDQQATERLRKVWASDQLVIDYYHRSELPAWWQAAHVVRLDADHQNPRYRHMVLDKLFPWNSHTQTGVCQFDNPAMTRADHPIARQFQNQYRYDQFRSEDEWYNFALEDPRMSFEIPTPKYDLEQIVSQQGLHQTVADVAQQLQSDYNRDDLDLVWQRWSTANSRYLD